jgi:hypothetical protein
MEVILSSETSVTIYHTPQYVISEYLNLCQLFFQNLKFFIPNINFMEISSDILFFVCVCEGPE